MKRNQAAESLKLSAFRWPALIVSAAMLFSLIVTAAKTFAQTRPTFADVASTATTVTDVNPLVVPFHHPCQLQDEFEARRCLQSRPRLQARARAGRWRADIEDDALVGVSRYDFERHRFELVVHGVIWLGAVPPTQSTGQEFVLATGQSHNGSIQQQPLVRQYLTIPDDAAAEAWRNRNTPDRLIVSVVFRLDGPPWADQIDPNGMSPRTRFGMTILPLAIQVRNRESGDVLTETVFDTAFQQASSLADGSVGGSDATTGQDAAATGSSTVDSSVRSAFDAGVPVSPTSTMLPNPTAQITQPTCPDEMVRIPEGTLTMGTADNGVGSDDERPQHPVHQSSSRLSVARSDSPRITALPRSRSTR